MIGIQQSRYLGFPSDAVHAFCNIENKIPAVTQGQPFGKLANMPDAVGGKAVGLKCLFKSCYRLFFVEFGCLFF